MDWLSCLIFLIALHYSASKDCVDLNPRSLDAQWEIKLHKDLEKCYEVQEPPGNKTVVKIAILMKYFTVNDEDGSMFVYSWTSLQWQDDRLKWDPKDYYGITETYFWSYDYWIPSVIQKNQAEQDAYPYYGKCKIRSTGLVFCRPRMENTAHCNASVRNWPYDTLNCTLEYGIYQDKGITLLPRLKKTVTMFVAEYGAEWIIIGYDEVYTPNKDVQIKVTFTLERIADALGAVIVFPSVLLAILTISTLFKDYEKFSRFWLTCFAVLCHFLFLTIISGNIPSYVSDVPIIMIFHRASMFLSCILVMVSLGLKSLRNRETVPPSWIRSVNSLVFNSNGKYVIWPRWETKKGIVPPESVTLEDVEAWNDFGNILNTFCWIICALIYFILYLMYVPKPLDALGNYS